MIENEIYLTIMVSVVFPELKYSQLQKMPELKYGITIFGFEGS